MELEFVKMQGCGNDYIYLDCRTTGLPAEVSRWAVELSPRHTSVGADGIICVCPPLNEGSHATMRMFNADGSEGRMCGNGIRCVAQFLYEHGVQEDRMVIDTPLDTSTPTKTLLRVGDGVWQVDMGRYRTQAADIPALNMGQGSLVNMPLEVSGKTWTVTCVSVGNPHCVTFLDTPVKELELSKIGPDFEHHPNFPHQINTEFVRVLGPDLVEMRVWERGSGETYACGTGACATAAACVELGIFKRDTDITVRLKGGELVIRVGQHGELTMTGPAKTVYRGAAYL